MNKILLVGIIGRDPETRGANRDIVTSSLAVDSYGKGEKQTDWFNLVIFGERGKAFLDHVKKGKWISIEGKVKTNKWEKDGVKRQDVDIIVDNWRFVGPNVQTESTSIGGPATWNPTDKRWP